MVVAPAGREVSVEVVQCSGRDSRSSTNVSSRFEMVLGRVGCHSVYRRDGKILTDPGTCLFGPPGTEYETGHPLGAGQPHGSTVVGFDADLLHSAGGDQARLPTIVRAPAQVEVAHRQLVGMVRRAVASEAVRELAGLLVTEVLSADGWSMTWDGSRTEQGGLDLFNDARQALLINPDLRATDLAAAVGCSPHYLSRLFTRFGGCGIATYRTMVRTDRVLDALADGEGNLADLAAVIGFSDHAHLTRSIRARFGSTPSTLRNLLAGPDMAAEPPTSASPAQADA